MEGKPDMAGAVAERPRMAPAALPEGKISPMQKPSTLGRVVRGAGRTAGAAAVGVGSMLTPAAAGVSHADVQHELDTRPAAGSTLEAVGLSRQTPPEIEIPDTIQSVEEVSGVVSEGEEPQSPDLALSEGSDGGITEGEEVAELIPEATAEPEAEPEPPASTDILSLPRWGAFGDTVVRLPDGSLQITTSPGATETKVPNLFDFIEVGPEGFEILVKAKTIPKGERDYYVTGAILLGNANSPRIAATIGIDEGSFRLDMFNSDNITVYREPITKPLTSSELKIVFTGIDNEERWNFYDGTNGVPLLESFQFPTPLLTSESNRLYFGFYPQAISAEGAIMHVEYFLFRPLPSREEELLAPG